MKITNAFIFVSLDNEKHLRQVFIKKQYVKQLIDLIESGMFHEGDVTISDKTLESIMIEGDSDETK